MRSPAFAIGFIARVRSRLRCVRAALSLPASVDPSAPPAVKLRAWLEQNTAVDQIAVSWREWFEPAKWMLVYVLFSQVAGRTPLAEVPLLLPLAQSALAILVAARAVPAGLRYGKALIRRRFLLKELLARGDGADLGELLRLVEAELASLPWRPAPVANSLLEQARHLLVLGGAKLVEGPRAVASRAVRAWIFGPTPQGEFPAYAETLLALIESEPKPEHLPVLLDLRDLTSHRPSSPAEMRIPERAGKAIGMVLEGMQQTSQPDLECKTSVSLADLLRASLSRNPMRRARAEQALLGLGPDTVSAVRQLKHQPRWWWRIQTVSSLLGLVAAVLVYCRLWPFSETVWNLDLPRDVAVVDVGDRPWAAAVAVYVAFASCGGMLSWLFAISARHERRLCQQSVRALSMMEGQEAAEGLLEVTRSLHRRYPNSPLTLQCRRQCARRLGWLSSAKASDALALHGDWFYNAPEGNANPGFVHDMLALIAHTWDPAARRLLRRWSRELKDGHKEEAARLLAEMEDRMSRQGTLVRPAAHPANPEHLLRVPRSMDSATKGLLRPATAERPEADNPEEQPLNATSTET